MGSYRRIFQTWWSKKFSDIPKNLQPYLLKWRQMHPSYEFYFLDDDDLRAIVKDVAPKHLKMYDSFTHTIERVDFARYAILYKYGGVYADIDTEPLKVIDKWVDMGKIVLGSEPREHAELLYGRSHVACNAFMISPPGKQMWLEFLDYIIREYEHNYKPVSNTGPLALDNFLLRYPKYMSDIVLTDPCVFYPLTGVGEVSKDCNITEAYVQHVWQNSWTGKWYDDPMWFNRRLWTLAASLLLMATIVAFIIYRRVSR